MFGPQVIFNGCQFGIRSRNGVELQAAPVMRVKDLITTIIGVYYLLDLSYTAIYGQLLGFLQEVLLHERFTYKSKKCSKFI